MKLSLKIHFETDGDFAFHCLDYLLDTKSSFYNGAIKDFQVIDMQENEELTISLYCEGDANGCRWAARDLLEHLVSKGISVVHYYLIKDLYDFLIIMPREKLLWSGNDVHYNDSMGGNYGGTYLSLDIVHEE